MILKVEDALKPFSQTPACRNDSAGRDPDCEAYRDLWVIFHAPCCSMKNIYRFIPRQLC